MCARGANRHVSRTGHFQGFNPDAERYLTQLLISNSFPIGHGGRWKKILRISRSFRTASSDTAIRPVSSFCFSIVAAKDRARGG